MKECIHKRRRNKFKKRREKNSFSCGLLGEKRKDPMGYFFGGFGIFCQ